MTERPIPFRDWEVRATLEGRKIHARRVIKPQPWVDDMGNACWKDSNFGQNAQGVPHIQSLASPVPSIRTKRVLCPYGAPGDLLWVRETWAQYPIELNPEPCDAWYKATSNGPPPPFKWRPSIHMPRWASRITLRITDVRVERLQDISEDDAGAEGMPDYSTLSEASGENLAEAQTRLRWRQRQFASLWNRINGPGTWEANPWVWVIGFERVKP